MFYRLDLDPETFLASHWQREHLFIPQGIARFKLPADANELAGLAMEVTVDSRMICGQGQGQDWTLSKGPFEERDYQQKGPWSLLVHGVDRHWDEAAALLGAVPWLPRWRLDDVMMSYATEGGSAGPHFDNYDVFIIQGEGRRRWKIGSYCDERVPLLDLPDLQLLAEFDVREEYVMECGDVLYIPPRCAHYGVSIGESTSFSIGFRAPRMSDLLARWVDNRITTLEDDQLLRDPGREPASRPGEITDRDLERARLQLRALLDDEDGRWLGEAVTQTDEPEIPPLISDTIDLRLETELAPGARLAWHELDGEVLVFCAGSSRGFPALLQPVVEALCAGKILSTRAVVESHDVGAALLHWLLEEGTIELHER